MGPCDILTDLEVELIRCLVPSQGNMVASTKASLAVPGCPENTGQEEPCVYFSGWVPVSPEPRGSRGTRAQLKTFGGVHVWVKIPTRLPYLYMYCLTLLGFISLICNTGIISDILSGLGR